MHGNPEDLIIIPTVNLFEAENHLSPYFSLIFGQEHHLEF